LYRSQGTIFALDDELERGQRPVRTVDLLSELVLDV
jgi:hypothetical protein